MIRSEVDADHVGNVFVVVPGDLEPSLDNGSDLAHNQRRIDLQLGDGQAADSEIAKTAVLNLRCQAKTQIWNGGQTVSIENVEKSFLALLQGDPSLVVQDFGQAEGGQRHEIGTSLEATAGRGREVRGVRSRDDEAHPGVKADLERVKDGLGLLDFVHKDESGALRRRTNAIQQERGVGGDSIPEAHIIARKRKDGSVRGDAVEEVLDEGRLSTPDDSCEDQGSWSRVREDAGQVVVYFSFNIQGLAPKRRKCTTYDTFVGECCQFATTFPLQAWRAQP
ncbi:MAG: hypothetical protein WCP29_19415 [Acidobacteriota bacterium]